MQPHDRMAWPWLLQAQDWVEGSWGRWDPTRVAAPSVELHGEETHTSVGDAVLHLGTQLSEEDVLSWLQCWVIEENLKERKERLVLSHPVTPHRGRDIRRFSRAPRCERESMTSPWRPGEYGMERSDF